MIQMAAVFETIRCTGGLSVYLRAVPFWVLQLSETGDESMERRGYFHQKYGGQYMPEALMNTLGEMEGEHQFVAQDQCFTNELDFFKEAYGGRKTPLYKARLLSKKYGPDIYFKREDLLPYGGSSFQTIAGQMIIGKRIGRRKVIIPVCLPEHGCIAAGLAAAMGLACEVFIPEMTAKAYPEAVQDMICSNAAVTEVTGDYRETCRQAEANWLKLSPQVVYIETRAAGPAPYPLMTREYQKVIGEEIREQILESCGRLPELVVASAGVDATAIGTMIPFIEDSSVKLTLVEANENPVYAKGEEGIADGMRSLFIQDSEMKCVPGQETSGCYYPTGAEPELVGLLEQKRAGLSSVTREEAMDAALETAALEGFLPDEYSSYAVAEVLKTAHNYALDENVVVAISGHASKYWKDACLKRRAER